MSRVYNFSAGPSMLPLEVLETAAKEMLDYNGSGMHIIEGIFHGEEVSRIAFLMKIIFTAITIGSGFRGGEIVPTLFIGATLGFASADVVGLPVGLCAAIGMIALFAGVTNCPIASVFLSVELFGAEGLLYYALSIFVCFVLSGYFSLYSGQKIVFSKIKKLGLNSLIKDIGFGFSKGDLSFTF